MRSLTAAVVATVPKTSKTSTNDDCPLDWAEAPEEDVKPQALFPSQPIVLDEDLSKEDYEKYSSMNISTRESSEIRSAF